MLYRTQSYYVMSSGLARYDFNTINGSQFDTGAIRISSMKYLGLDRNFLTTIKHIGNRCVINLIVLVGISMTEVSCNDRTQVHREYYENGKLKATIEMKREKWHGVSKMYDENGMLWKQVQWTDGVQHGPAIIFFPNGKIKERHEFVNGKIVGKSEMFYLNGTLAEEKFFDSLGKLYDVRSYTRSGERDYDKVYPIGYFSKDTVTIGSDIEYFTKLVNTDSTIYNEGILIITSRLTESGDAVDTLYSLTSTNEKGFRYSVTAKSPGVNGIYGILAFEIPVDAGRVYTLFSFRKGFYVTPNWRMIGLLKILKCCDKDIVVVSRMSC